ncbi:hypothetical protein FOZ62_010121, partial [Perkinsus olseni]
MAAIDGLDEFIAQLTEEQLPAVTQRARLLHRTLTRVSATLEYSAESLGGLFDTVRDIELGREGLKGPTGAEGVDASTRGAVDETYQAGTPWCCCSREAYGQQSSGTMISVDDIVSTTRISVGAVELSSPSRGFIVGVVLLSRSRVDAGNAGNATFNWRGGSSPTDWLTYGRRQAVLIERLTCKGVEVFS